MKIELESFNVSIVEDGEDFIARIRFNRADDRLIVGDSGTGLMNEVIEVVQAHTNKLTEDLQVIRDVRSGKNLTGGSTAPETLKVGECEVPEPCREVPEVGQKVWAIHPINRVEPFTWYNSKACHDALESGFVLLTEEAAEKHYKAFKNLLTKK